MLWSHSALRAMCTKGGNCCKPASDTNPLVLSVDVLGIILLLRSLFCCVLLLQNKIVLIIQYIHETVFQL